MDGFAAQHRWLTLSAVCVGAALVVLAAGTTSYMIAGAALPTRTEVQACDRVVATLLGSRNLVEVNRAGWLAQLMRCDVSRRLPRPE